jgi:hypothetical protein
VQVAVNRFDACPTHDISCARAGRTVVNNGLWG